MTPADPHSVLPVPAFLKLPPPRNLSEAQDLLARSRGVDRGTWIILAGVLVVLMLALSRSRGFKADPMPAILPAVLLVVGIGWLARFVARSRARVSEMLLRSGHVLPGRVVKFRSATMHLPARFEVEFQDAGGAKRHVVVDFNAGRGFYGVGHPVLVLFGDAAPGRAAVIVRMGVAGDFLQVFAGRLERQ